VDWEKTPGRELEAGDEVWIVDIDKA
jgi:hypothetical protein